MRETIVTTAGRPNEEMEQRAKAVASSLHYRFFERKKRSVAKMQEVYNAHVIVVGKERYEYFAHNHHEPFFFHPNSAAYRLKRLAKEGTDPLVDVCELKQGDSFLDCTLGIGSDSIVASFAVGEKGKVVGIEANKNVAYIVREGMQTYDTTELPLTTCMRQIEVIHADAINYLKSLPANSFDVVYLDPMFEEIIEEATNFETLRNSGEHIALSHEWVQEARRVASKRVVLKAHYQSPYFEQFGFMQLKRQTSKFHYGVLKV